MLDFPPLPDDGPTLYTLIAKGPNGQTVISTNHTLAGGWRLMWLLRAEGYGPHFDFVSEQPAPIPDHMLCPCAQPAPIQRGA